MRTINSFKGLFLDAETQFIFNHFLQVELGTEEFAELIEIAND
jgi:hypothetical protein